MRISSGQEEVFGKNLAARNARHVGDDALHLMNTVVGQKLGDGVFHTNSGLLKAL